MKFNLQPDRVICNNYKIISYLGSGYEGEVYKVEELDTGIVRAAKFFYKRNNNKLESFVQYAKKLHKLGSCPIIIQYHHKDSIMVRKKKVDYVVSDYVDGEVLSDYINRQRVKRLSNFEALHIFYTLVRGIEHIHFLGEYHGDIHTDNIILKRKGLGFGVKIIDILHLGRTTKDRIQEDVYDLITVLYELLGEKRHYNTIPANLKSIILGRKKSLIAKKFKNAGQLRLYLDNLSWD